MHRLNCGDSHCVSTEIIEVGEGIIFTRLLLSYIPGNLFGYQKLLGAD